MVENVANVYKGYNELYGEHYYKWEHAQSAKYFEYRKKWEENAKKLIIDKFPLHLDIGITNVCNLQCTFCARTLLVEDGQFREPKHMDIELYKKIIDQAAEAGTYSINLNMLNEPMTNPKLIEMIHYAKEKGIVDVHFHSHGGLLTEERAHQLLDSGLDKLLISIDTPNKEKYEKLRVLSNHDTVISNLKRFKKIRDDRGQLNPLIRCNFIQFPNITKEDLRANLEFGLELADCVGFQEYIDPTQTIGEERKYQEEYSSQFVCQQPFTRLSIIEDGRVSPCCIDYKLDLVIGDLNRQTLAEIWMSNKMEHIRKIHREGKFYTIPTCRNCEMAINGDEGRLTPYERYGPTI